MTNEIQYARSGDGTHIAYRAFGEPSGPDYVVVAGALFSVELLDEDRIASRFLDGLASMGRVVVFDKRGVGSSDPLSDWTRSAQAQWAEDLMTVASAAGLVDPIVVSWEPMGVARLAASRWPEVFSKMVLTNPAASPGGLMRSFLGSGEHSFESRTVEELAFPSRIHDPDFETWLVRAGRVGASPSMAPRLWGHVLSYDLPFTPAGITPPTLVLHNADSMVRLEWIDDVVERLENGELVTVPGADAYPIAGDIDPLILEIARFTEREATLPSHRAVHAVLFTDLVGSTERAVASGDRAWEALLEHHDGDVSGVAVNVAARVMALTPDGETLVTTSVAESAVGTAHEFVAAGADQLKGIAGTWNLHRYDAST